MRYKPGGQAAHQQPCLDTIEVSRSSVSISASPFTRNLLCCGVVNPADMLDLLPHQELEAVVGGPITGSCQRALGRTETYGLLSS